MTHRCNYILRLMEDLIVTKRALISVSDKNGILEFAKELVALVMKYYQLVEQKNYLQENNVPVTAVDEVTKFPEILDGRVKTLNPMIHGGLLGKFDEPFSRSTNGRAWHRANRNRLCKLISFR